MKKKRKEKESKIGGISSSPTYFKLSELDRLTYKVCWRMRKMNFHPSCDTTWMYQPLWRKYGNT